MTGLVIGTGVGFSGPLRIRSGVTVGDPDAVALIARMTMPTDDRIALISKLIDDLKSAGIWSKLDGFWVLAAHDAQAAGLNWRAATMELVPVQAPSFTPDRGYKGNGRGAYLSIPNAAATSLNYTYRNASFGCWTLSAPAAFAVTMGQDGGRTYLVVNASASEPALAARVNNAGGNGYAVLAGVDGRGMTHASRASAYGYTLRQRDLPRVTVSQSALSPRSPPTSLLSGISTAGLTYSAAEIAAAYFGAALTDTEELAMNAALGSYLGAVLRDSAP